MDSRVWLFLPTPICHLFSSILQDSGVDVPYPLIPLNSRLFGRSSGTTVMFDSTRWNCDFVTIPVSNPTQSVTRYSPKHPTPNTFLFSTSNSVSEIGPSLSYLFPNSVSLPLGHNR